MGGGVTAALLLLPLPLPLLDVDAEEEDDDDDDDDDDDEGCTGVAPARPLPNRGRGIADAGVRPAAESIDDAPGTANGTDDCCCCCAEPLCTAPEKPAGRTQRTRCVLPS